MNNQNEIENQLEKLEKENLILRFENDLLYLILKKFLIEVIKYENEK